MVFQKKLRGISLFCMTVFVASAVFALTKTASADPIAFVNHLEVGSRGIEVRNLQQLLTTQGVYAGPITGYFGPLTRAGVVEFQTKYGIDPVGEVGPITRAKLNSLAPAGLSSAGNQNLQDQISGLQTKLDALTASSAASASILQSMQDKINNLQSRVNALSGGTGAQTSGLGGSLSGAAQTPQLQAIQSQISAVQNIQNQLSANPNQSLSSVQSQLDSLQQLQNQTNSSLLQSSAGTPQDALMQSLLNIQNQVITNPGTSLQELQAQISALQLIQSQLSASYLNSQTITTQP